MSGCCRRATRRTSRAKRSAATISAISGGSTLMTTRRSSARSLATHTLLMPPASSRSMTYSPASACRMAAVRSPESAGAGRLFATSLTVDLDGAIAADAGASPSSARVASARKARSRAPRAASDRTARRRAGLRLCFRTRRARASEGGVPSRGPAPASRPHVPPRWRATPGCSRGRLRRAPPALRAEDAAQPLALSIDPRPVFAGKKGPPRDVVRDDGGTERVGHSPCSHRTLGFVDGVGGSLDVDPGIFRQRKFYGRRR